jgi:hypothetical protein
VASVPGSSITADISGSVSHSQIAVGEKIVQHNYAAGSTVNFVAGERRPPRERQRPVSQLPRDLPHLYGREPEDLAGAVAGIVIHPVVGRIVGAAGSVIAAELHGER